MTTTRDADSGATTPDAPASTRSEGPAAAALLAAGIGAFTLGLLTTLAEASEGVADGLAFSSAVGPLSGKTIIAVVVWLAAWPVLYVTMGRRAALTRGVLVAFAVLLALGVLGTFPTFFEAFAAE